VHGKGEGELIRFNETPAVEMHSKNFVLLMREEEDGYLYIVDFIQHDDTRLYTNQKIDKSAKLLN